MPAPIPARLPRSGPNRASTDNWLAPLGTLECVLFLSGREPEATLLLNPRGGKLDIATLAPTALVNGNQSL